METSLVVTLKLRGNFMCAPREADEPKNYQEAMKSPTFEEWKLAMQDKIESMRKNQVWDLIDLPHGRRTIENKWVLKVKRNAEGFIDRYKARLVARFASIRLILAILAHLDLELYQMMWRQHFSNEELDEKIYMDQLVGFIANGEERKVYKLWRSIYGLKQSSRQWYFKFHRAVTSNGFMMIEEDHCVYVKQSKGNFLILSLYVNDMLLAGNDKEMIVATHG